jgi:hypothetical protein
MEPDDVNTHGGNRSSSCSAPSPPCSKPPRSYDWKNIALRRQQLAVLRRLAPKRLRLTSADRIFWIWLRHMWSDWNPLSSFAVFVLDRISSGSRASGRFPISPFQPH